MIEIKYPWEVDRAADRFKWGVGYLEQRSLPLGIYLKPDDDRLVNQIKCIVEWTLGSRNWMVCICSSTSYMRTLFGYVLATYVFTTKERAIADCIITDKSCKCNFFHRFFLCNYFLLREY